MNGIWSYFFLLFVVCHLSEGYTSTQLQKIKQQVAKYKDVANQIIELSVNGKAQNQSYDRLAVFTDTFGPRLAGSENLEMAIDYMLEVLKEDGLENVHGEAVQVPHWVRGKESAAMLEPRYHALPMLGLGTSIGTGPEGLKADVIVVKTFDELDQRAQEVPGKIVVYNFDFVSYGVSVAYRSLGASRAAKYGAVASLIKSVTPLSVDSPHTGMQDYQSGIKKIPTACITVEDAEMMWRMEQRGEKVRVFLNMSAENLPPVTSRNTVAEIKGSLYPDQVVLVSGHLDSWDVGEGAMDDGGGAFISWQALSLIRQLGLRPKRTLRAVLWTAEEFGGIGAQGYFKKHQDEVETMDLVMESDVGTFTPLGLQFKGNLNATLIMKEIVDLLESINATQLISGGDIGTDVAPWISAGVPGASLVNEDEKYFYFHHTNGDTMTVQDPIAMNLCSAVWAVAAYTVADLDEMLPRGTQQEPSFEVVPSEVLLEQSKRTKTVVNKTNVIDNTYRTFELELLAGEENYITQVKENNCVFEMDFSKVYWNSRLGKEHLRVIQETKPGDVVFDVFAGIGPFALPCAKQKLTVFANDLNPVSYEYLLKNRQKNKITEDRLKVFCLDGREFIQTIVKEELINLYTEGSVYYEYKVHIVMNLPAIAVTFIDAFQSLLEETKLTIKAEHEPMVYCYCFTDIHEADKHFDGDMKKEIKARVRKYLPALSEDEISLFLVRNVAPNKDMMRINFTLRSDILCGQHTGQDETEEPPVKCRKIEEGTDV